ncbi:MAG: hypothetical protein HYS12_06555 [Planctomycetes bacterium]|nr:hypothetical protein [Planctomycetota bacterium]
MAQQPNSENVPAPLWLPCPAGEFERLSSRLRHRQQRRAVLKGVAGLAAATLTGGGLWLWLRSGSDGGPDYAGIRCEEWRFDPVAEQRSLHGSREL